MAKQTVTHLQDNKFYADNVRIAYPDLFEAKHFKNDSKNTARFGATLLIPKGDTASYKLLKDHITRLTKADLKMDRIPAADVCLKDGDESNTEAYHDHWYINAYKYPKNQSNLSVGGPDVVDTAKPPNRLREGDANVPCSGDFCDVIFEVYAGAKWKKINGGLSVVRFRSKGEPIGGGNDAALLPEVPDTDEDEDEDV
jgi:hypothetical protein